MTEEIKLLGEEVTLAHQLYLEARDLVLEDPTDDEAQQASGKALRHWTGLMKLSASLMGAIKDSHGLGDTVPVTDVVSELTAIFGVIKSAMTSLPGNLASAMGALGGDAAKAQGAAREECLALVNKALVNINGRLVENFQNKRYEP